MARVKTFSNGGTVVPTDLNAIQDYIDTQDAANTANDELLRTLVGANNIAGSTIRRGKSIIATSESRTNTAYGLMTTPDRVQNVVLPADGLIVVAYQATWQETVAGAARAALFIGANQLKVATEGQPAAITEAATTGSGGATSQDKTLGSCAIGLVSSGGDYSTGDVTTGQVVGFATQAATTNIEFSGITRATPSAAVPMAGPCYIFASAGTYDVSVQFKASSGSVSAKNRKLWVWSINF